MMASHERSIEPPRCGPDVPYDKRRLRDFYRYYEPHQELASQKPKWADLHDDLAIAGHKPIPCPDQALTAFCKLGALQLNVKRAMVFLFDAEYGYVLAESTRTLSLRHRDQQTSSEDLWLGHARIPRGYSVCEHTVNLPANIGSERRDASPAGLVHIINDLADDSRFCNRPFVTDGPQLRFYAGAPLTTPRGYNIGAFCALHDEPREFSSPDMDVLLDLAGAVMNHFVTIRATFESRRRSAMFRGLTAFTHRVGTSYTDLKWNNDTSATDSPSEPLAKETEPETSDVLNSRAASPVTRGVPDTGKPQADRTSFDAPTRLSDVPDASSDAGMLHPTSGLDLAEGIRRTYQIAADTLRTALDVDGVVFLDGCSAQSAPGHSPNIPSQQQSPMESSTRAPGSSESSDDDTLPTARSRAQQGFCDLLAASHAVDANLTAGDVQLTPRTLSYLSQNHAQGKLWRLSIDTEDSAEDSTSSASAGADPSAHTATAPDRTRSTRTAEGQPSIRRVARQAAIVRQAFPAAQSIMFLPLWKSDPSRRCCGIFVYLRARTRYFTAGVELQFLRTFGDILMAEIARLDSQYILRTKSTFVASMSHELRTPLHGILGTVEYLREFVADPIPSRLVSQIEVCGQTMLETVNHLLEFGHAEQDRRRFSLSGRAEKEVRNQPEPSRDTRPASTPNVDDIVRRPQSRLDRITENSIDSVVHAFHWRESVTAGPAAGTPGPDSSFRVTTIFEIIDEPGIDWLTDFGSGAWNRICIDLIGNALKYTTGGYVHITLQLERPSKRGPGKPVTALLVITDTGRGMSRAFMQSSLFEPFEQEDAIVEGTGIGMSLVAKLLKSLGGRINVESSQNVGTTVTVSIPLAQSQRRAVRKPEKETERHQREDQAALDTSAHRDTSGMDASDPDSLIAAQFSHGLDDIGDEQDSNSDGSVNVRNQAMRRLRDALSRSIEHLSSQLRAREASTPKVSINFVLDGDLAQIDHAADPPGDTLSSEGKPSSTGSPTPLLPSDRPCIILCGTFQRLHRCMAAVAALREPFATHVEYVVQPYGPMQLNKALVSCIRAVVPSLPSGLLTPSTASPAPLAQSSSPNDRRRAAFESGGASMTPESSGSRSQGGIQDGYFSHRSRAWRSASGRINQNPTGVPASYFAASATTARPQPTPALTPMLTPLSGTLSDASPKDKPAKVLSTDADTAREQPPERRVDARNHPAVWPGPSTLAEREDVLILMVDDNNVNMRLLTMFANRQRYRHISAENGLRAVELYQAGMQTDQQEAATPGVSSPSDQARSPSSLSLTTSSSSSSRLSQCPQVILMDISMPVMDGFEATRQIRALEAKTPGAPRALIIAMTGLGRDTAKQEARESGMDHFMTKPVRMRELSALLDKLISSPSSPTSAVS